MQNPANRRHDLRAIALLLTLLALTVFVYWPGLPGPLLLDDVPQLDPLIEQSAAPPAFLLKNYVMSTSGPLGRPVSMASFVADAVAHGPDLWWWKFDSLMLHLVCGLLLAWLMAELVGTGERDKRVESWMAGILVAGLWLLHPLNVSTVLYVVQRMTVLSTLFVFAGLLCYVKGRLLQSTRPNAGWVLIAIAFAVCMPLAVFSKESGALFPVYCTLVEFIVLRFRGAEQARLPLRVGHGILLVTYVATAGLLLANSGLVTDAYAAREFTLVERVLTEFRVLVVYLAQILLPLPGRMGFFHDDFPISRGLLDPATTLLSMLVVCGSAATAWGLRKHCPLGAFGLLFFFASHGLESTVFGLEIMFEHRNYAGSPGIILALVVGVAAFARRQRIVAATAIVAVGVLSALTWQRASLWSSPLSMYQHMYAVHPDSSRLNMIFSNIYAKAGEFDNARRMLEKVSPGAGRTLNALYFDCLERGRVDPNALSQLGREASRVMDSNVIALVDLLVDASIQGRCQVPRVALAGAMDQLLTLQDRSYRDSQSILLAKARLLDAMGETDAALQTYLKAQALSDVHAMPLYRAADALARRGMVDDARALLKRAADVEERSRIVRKDLAERIYAGIGQWYVRAGRPQDAVATYDEALDAMPDRLQFHVAKAELQLGLGRDDEASRTLAEIGALCSADELEYERRIARIRSALESRPAVISEDQ